MKSAFNYQRYCLSVLVVYERKIYLAPDPLSYPVHYLMYQTGGGGPMAKNGEKWRKMAKNGDGEFGFFICQIRHFSPIFDFGILHLTDFQTANHLETLQSHYWHRYRTNATHIE